MTALLDPGPLEVRRRALAELVAEPGMRVAVVATSRDHNPKLTLMLVPLGGVRPALVAKVPLTDDAARAVEREGHMLCALRGRRLGPLATTVPRCVNVLEHEGRPVLLATAVPGTPMATTYHAWRHTARHRTVAADLRAAGEWLGRFQQATARASAPVTWPGEVAARLAGRFPDEPETAAALDVLAGADAVLGGLRVSRTAVHGDFWAGNVLRDPVSGAVSGVVDWESGDERGEPLRDLARFALAYSLYLDRHTRPGRRVRGHRGLRADGFGAGVRYALAGRGWYAAEIRDFLGRGLAALDVPRAAWREVVLTGVAEVAATADHAGFAREHLRLLGGLGADRARGRWA